VLSIYDGSNTKALTAGMQAALRCKKSLGDAQWVGFIVKQW
jgi:hypothetical protein